MLRPGAAQSVHCTASHIDKYTYEGTIYVRLKTYIFKKY